jgi:hypothetical protein
MAGSAAETKLSNAYSNSFRPFFGKLDFFSLLFLCVNVHGFLAKKNYPCVQGDTDE